MARPASSRPTCSPPGRPCWPSATSICPGRVQFAAPAGGPQAQLAHDALLAQHLMVEIAAARGITPGVFTYGRKVTTAL